MHPKLFVDNPICHTHCWDLICTPTPHNFSVTPRFSAYLISLELIQAGEVLTVSCNTYVRTYQYLSEWELGIVCTYTYANHTCSHSNAAVLLLQVFFAVLIGAFSIGQAAPNLDKLVTAAGASVAIYDVIDRVSSYKFATLSADIQPIRFGL